MWEAIAALIPSVGVGLIFWFAVRAMLRADRRERQVLARHEREGRDHEPDLSDERPEGAGEAHWASRHDDPDDDDEAGGGDDLAR